MIKSTVDNLFTSIFCHETNSASLIIKFLLVLETEKLIPLFNISTNENNQSPIDAVVTNRQNEILLVRDIIQETQEKPNLPTLFFGSNFSVNLAQGWRLGVVDNLKFNTFLIFTQEGFILENPEPYLSFLPHHRQEYYTQLSEKYSFIPWDYWQNITLKFAEDKPECTLILHHDKNHYLQINLSNNSNSEAEQIESQLPLIFCYFILKRFWRYVEEFRQKSFFIFNPHDFLYLDCDRLSYFITNVLKNIDITEEDLDQLIRSC
ncbi:hypothetical protein VKI21_05845 [Cyanobacterium aponinum UTEX 3222]|uniref:hypothetical protein n=1 Tax=Cyanobacterium aponinum TaxID=379064 RepID=UPI0030923150|nr:hypothetical protein VKI21_05845 [Cyanobacterium aponinum UTEX 3222]